MEFMDSAFWLLGFLFFLLGSMFVLGFCILYVSDLFSEALSKLVKQGQNLKVWIEFVQYKREKLRTEKK